MKMAIRIVLLVTVVAAAGMLHAQTITTTGSGNWSSTTADTPWPGGVLPAASNDVVIADGSTVTLDQNASVTNLTVGGGTTGILQFNKTKQVILTVNGNLTLQKGSTLKVQSRDAATPEILDSVFVSKDFNNKGAATFDMRSGSSGSTLVVCNVVFTGSGVSTVTQGVYNSSTNEFNGIEIRKIGTGKIVLGSDVVMAGGSTTQPNASPVLKLNGGLIETGPNKIVATYGNSGCVSAGSSTSYVVGALGRGMSNSSGTARNFPVGDANGYRPINVSSTTGGVVTQHMAIVRCVSGDANIKGSTYVSGIDLVSHVRYYSLKYSKELSGASGAADDMGFFKFYPSYGKDDGVAAGNSNLRVAYSIDSLKTWKGMEQTTFPHLTDLSNPPTTIQPDSLNPAVTLKANPQQTLYIALAKVVGTKENTLSASTGIAHGGLGALSQFALEQNFPNPFNPSTEIRYDLAKAGHVRLTVFNAQGQVLATLVDRGQTAGNHKATWNARTAGGTALPSGIYVYKLEMNGISKTAKMTLMK